ncbi:MAG: hypothetical protein QM802_17795 [Agriterribacter sp.]
MRKYLFLFVFYMLSVASVNAQTTDNEVEFNKIKRPVKTIEVKQEADIVEEAVKNKMVKAGYKSTETKGWLVFKNVDDREISAEVCDLYVKVEKKSKKEKETSLVHFFLTKPNDNATPVELAGSMLASEGFQGQVSANADATKLEKDIAEQEDATKKAQKKLDDLVKDQASMEKKIKNLQDDLEQNKSKQQTQTQEVENQRKILEQLKSKRNS